MLRERMKKIARINLSRLNSRCSRKLTLRWNETHLWLTLRRETPPSQLHLRTKPILNRLNWKQERLTSKRVNSQRLRPKPMKTSWSKRSNLLKWNNLRSVKLPRNISARYSRKFQRTKHRNKKTKDLNCLMSTLATNSWNNFLAC